MRYFLTDRLPVITRVMLIESGRREILERLIPALRRIWAMPCNSTCSPTIPVSPRGVGDIWGYR